MTDFEQARSERHQRAAARRARMAVHRTTSFAEADLWDLKFWQARSARERLSALVAIHDDVAAVERARSQADMEDAG